MWTKSAALLFMSVTAAMAQGSTDSIILTEMSVTQTNKATGAYNWALTWVDESALFVSSASGNSTSDQSSFTDGHGGTSIGGNLQASPSFSFGPIINGDVTILVKNSLYPLESTTIYNYAGNATVGVQFGGETIQTLAPFTMKLKLTGTSPE